MAKNKEEYGVMKKLFFVLIVSIVNLAAVVHTQIKYEATLSVLGKIGEAELTVRHSEHRYEVTLFAKATGLAAVISGNEEDLLISRGRMTNGRMVSEHYEQQKRSNERTEIIQFEVDNSAQKIHKYVEKNETVTESLLDVFSMSYSEESHQVITREEEVLDYYSDYDPISSLASLHLFIELHNPFHIRAIGAVKEDVDVIMTRLKGPDFVTWEHLIEEKSYDQLLMVRIINHQKEKEHSALVFLDAEGMILEIIGTKWVFPVGYGSLRRIEN
ncbi:MAG: hypothetical protein DRG24_09175 [Epsilonproteobacteria bacterium]|nr:MAG: hypothetical protein DRG24_09175 [Campylobacterota bacterium]